MSFSTITDEQKATASASGVKLYSWKDFVALVGTHEYTLPVVSFIIYIPYKSQISVKCFADPCQFMLMSAYKGTFFLFVQNLTFKVFSVSMAQTSM